MGHPFYGLPSAEGGGFKVAPDRFGPPWDPSDGDRLVDPDAVRVAREYAAMRFPALARQPVIEARVCQYEMTPDSHFLIDRHPELSNVWLVGGGSGHGYKHGPEIGRHVVGRLDGEPAPDDNRFALDRPRAAPGAIRIGGDGLVAGWEGY
jgi:glycine/D-amino acid oxidase-like deaminating enzyme